MHNAIYDRGTFRGTIRMCSFKVNIHMGLQQRFESHRRHKK